MTTKTRFVDFTALYYILRYINARINDIDGAHLIPDKRECQIQSSELVASWPRTCIGSRVAHR